MQVPYLTIVTSLLSQVVMTWAYKHPDIKWINKKNIQFASALFAAISGVLTAYASGTLDQGIIANAFDASFNAFISSGLAVAFYEWTKEKRPE